MVLLILLQSFVLNIGIEATNIPTEFIEGYDKNIPIEKSFKPIPLYWERKTERYFYLL